MPMHINAPSRKLTHTASAKRQPARANAVPPGGNAPRFFNTKKNAATSRATPMKDRKSTRLNSSHLVISYAVFCLKKKKNTYADTHHRLYDTIRTHVIV